MQWSALEVLLFSVLGFSGSGQFALLPLAAQGFDLLAMLVIAVSINSRYLPIAFVSAGKLPRPLLQRASLAHMLGDEAYALEHETDGHAQRWGVRLTIYLTWVAATVGGALLAGVLPAAWFDHGLNLGFPASVVLLILSLNQLKARVPHIRAGWARRGLELVLCLVVGALLFAWLGKVWFWLPSILFTTWRLWKAGA